MNAIARKRSNSMHAPDSESVSLLPSVQEFFNNREAHTFLLSDSVRLRAFRQAIHEVVRPGDVVMDIGAGTGILAQYAIEAGAALVILVEENAAILAIARQRLAPFTHQAEILYFPRRSSSIGVSDLNCRVDVIVSETLGSLGVNEGIVKTLADARRFLVPTGKMIPASLALYCAPCVAPPIQNRSHLTVVRGKTRRSLRLLEEMKPIAEFSFRASEQTTMYSPAEFDLYNGISLAFCFVARLSPSITLHNAATGPETSWGTVLLMGADNLSFGNTTTLSRAALACEASAIRPRPLPKLPQTVKSSSYLHTQPLVGHGSESVSVLLTLETERPLTTLCKVSLRTWHTARPAVTPRRHRVFRTSPTT